MPIRVNHEERRQLVAITVANIIGDQGLDAVTVRSVATAAGFSTKLVSRYFADKRSLLLFSYEAAAHRSRERVRNALANNRNDIMKGICALLPLTAEATRDWQVWFAFWGMATADPEFSSAQVVQLRKARSLLAPLLKRGYPQQLSDADSQDASYRLLTIIIGVAIQAIHEPAEWPQKKQMEYIARVLKELESETTKVLNGN